MELPAHRIPPSGRRSARWAKGAPSNGSPASVVRASQPRRARSAVRSAASHASSQRWPRAGTGRRRSPPVRRSPVASTSASAWAVADASACTNVVGRIAGSRQPPSPSTTTCGGRSSSSRVRMGFDVGMAPKRRTRPGTCASRQRPGRRSWSPRASTWDRSWPTATDQRERVGQDRPVRGRRQGGPAPPGGRGSSCGPATMRPRSTPTRRRARRSTPSPAEDRSAARSPTSASSAASSGPSGPSGTSGSRNGMLRWTGPAGPATAVATARAPTARTWRAGHGLAVEQRQLGEPLGVGSEQADLVDRLGGPAIAQLGRSVGREEEQRHAAQRRLDDGREEVGRGGTRGREDGHRAAARPSPAPGRRSRRSARRAARAPSHPGGRAGPGRGASSASPGRRRVAEPGADQLIDEGAQRERGRSSPRPPGAPGPRPPDAASSGTPPTPGPGRSPPRCRSPRRASPAGRPRARSGGRPPARRRRRRRASRRDRRTSPGRSPRARRSGRARRRRGSPPTAGVGWRRSASARMPDSSRRTPSIGVTRCWTWRSARIPGSAATASRSTIGPQRVAKHRDDHGMLLAVLVAGQQPGRQPGILGGVRAARRGSGERHGVEDAAPRCGRAARALRPGT